MGEYKTTSDGICRPTANKAHSYPEGKWRDHKKSRGGELGGLSTSTEILISRINAGSEISGLSVAL